MEQSDSRLRDILARFWDWAGYDAISFAKDGFTYADEKEPFFFPELYEMRRLCYACELGLWSAAEAEDYLTCMALDNEEEYILAHCADYAGDSFIAEITQVALTHPQWHGRWQVAELLWRREVPLREMYLCKLSQDPHPYVRRRAKGSLENLNL